MQNCRHVTAASFQNHRVHLVDCFFFNRRNRRSVRSFVRSFVRLFLTIATPPFRSSVPLPPFRSLSPLDCSFIHSFVRSFVGSLVHSFGCSKSPLVDCFFNHRNRAGFFLIAAIASHSKSPLQSFVSLFLTIAE